MTPKLRILALAGLLAAPGLVACGPPTLPLRAAPHLPDSATVVTDTYFLEAKDGAPLFVRAWRPRTPPKAALAIVHGLLDHGERYDAFARRAAEAGFSVHAIDLRGHGRSSGMRAYTHAFGDYVDDTEAFVDAVHAREAERRVFLFGHSMGGAIVTTYAAFRLPEVARSGRRGIAGLVLSAPALSTERTGLVLKGSTHLTAALFPEAGVFSLDLDKFSRDPRVVAACKADPLVYTSPAPARTASGLVSAISALHDAGAHLRVPLLVMHGTADEVTEPEGSKHLHATALSADKTLTLYPGYVHDLLHEPEHTRVEADVIAWLSAR